MHSTRCASLSRAVSPLKPGLTLSTALRSQIVTPKSQESHARGRLRSRRGFRKEKARGAPRLHVFRPSRCPAVYLFRVAHPPRRSRPPQPLRNRRSHRCVGSASGATPAPWGSQRTWAALPALPPSRPQRSQRQCRRRPKTSVHGFTRRSRP
jgi:hypothetical protein